MRWLNLFGANSRRAGAWQPPPWRAATTVYNDAFEKPVVGARSHTVPLAIARLMITATGVDESSLHYRGWRVMLACFLMVFYMFGFGLYG